MKKLSIPIAILLAIIISASIVNANYETKTALITKFKNLVAAHTAQASYVSIGKSVKGLDILMFRFGNKSATGRILWDAQMHGSEDAGSETAYLFCQWLFTSDSRARYILTHNWILIVPAVDIDTTARTNLNHVNLNRNFPVGWGRSGDSSKISNDYMGPYGGSEPETNALVNVFKTYRLKFYINTHTFGGPIIYCQTAIPSSVIATLKSRLSLYGQKYGGNPTNTNTWSRLSTGGFSITTAESYGSYSFLWEIGGTTRPSWTSICDKYYKETRCFLIAICSMCG
jgi:hypothetical protein